MTCYLLRNFGKNLHYLNGLKKIEVMSGYSGEILKSLPQLDFCYVDGSQIYESVKQDFFRILKLVSKNQR